MRRENENLLKFSDDVKKRNDITERLREGDVFSLSSRKGHFTLKFGKPENNLWVGSFLLPHLSLPLLLLLHEGVRDIYLMVTFMM